MRSIPPPWHRKKRWAWLSFWIFSFERFLDEVMPQCAIRNFDALFPGRIQKSNFRLPGLHCPKSRGLLQRVAEGLRKQTLASAFYRPSRPSGRVWRRYSASQNFQCPLSTVILSMPIRSTIMRTLNRRSEFSTLRTRCTLSSVLDVDSHPACGSSFTLSRPSLKSLCHLETAVCGMLPSLNTWRIMPNPNPRFPQSNTKFYSVPLFKRSLNFELALSHSTRIH